MNETTIVRDALRRELKARGHQAASDTLGSRGELYVLGANDLAAALFEFKSSAREAFDTMYQGSWGAGMPPRFAVLPAASAEEDMFETLEQVRIIPLLYDLVDGTVVFRDLDRVLGEHLPG